MSELYTWVFLDADPLKSERELIDFLKTANIRIILELTKKLIIRAGELHANYIRRGGKRKRILADFLIGSYAEKYADVFVTWNPRDFNLKIPVLSPKDVLERI